VIAVVRREAGSLLVAGSHVVARHSLNVLRAQELILFSRADLERSIPCMVDGLKPGQRKIVFAAFKRNLRRDIKARI
jgi:DNA gyrase/topoisomerase IV subunit A